MAEKTGIAWTDSTFNPWIGCTKVGGCTLDGNEYKAWPRYRKASQGTGNWCAVTP